MQRKNTERKDTIFYYTLVKCPLADLKNPSEETVNTLIKSMGWRQSQTFTTLKSASRIGLTFCDNPYGEIVIYLEAVPPKPGSKLKIQDIYCFIPDAIYIASSNRRQRPPGLTYEQDIAALNAEIGDGFFNPHFIDTAAIERAAIERAAIEREAKQTFLCCFHKAKNPTPHTRAPLENFAEKDSDKNLRKLIMRF